MAKTTKAKHSVNGVKHAETGENKPYRAKAGETRTSIAQKFCISIETLTRLNPQIEYWGDLEGKTLNVTP